MQTMSQPYMQYEHESGIVARWHGGAYIDLGFVSDDNEMMAQDCINVWDHEKDEPTIPRTLSAMQERVDEHLSEED